jgi:AraC-like DNA-binding protein
MDRRISFLKNQILFNPRADFSINKMAEKVNVSPSHLFHLFNCELGVSPACFVRDTRIELAKTLLETTFKRIKEISYEVGFNDQRTFAQEFKRKYKLSPLNYQKQYWAEIENVDAREHYS